MIVGLSSDLGDLKIGIFYDNYMAKEPFLPTRMLAGKLVDCCSQHPICICKLSYARLIWWRLEKSRLLPVQNWAKNLSSKESLYTILILSVSNDEYSSKNEA